MQIKIERVSKELLTPPKAGDLHSRRWFYERARGQYRSLFSYILAGLGSADAVGINETCYKRAVGKAILFKSLDEAIHKADWYQSDRGYKAQIVTYTVAACADGFRKAGYKIDLDRIWQSQEVPSVLLDWMLMEASRVADILKSPLENVRNISEYAKRVFCWESAIQGKVGQPTEKLLDYGMTLGDFADVAAAGKRTGKLNQEVDFDVALLNIVPQVSEIRSAAEKSGLASRRNTSALSKLGSGNINLTKSEKSALKALLERLEIAL